MFKNPPSLPAPLHVAFKSPALEMEVEQKKGRFPNWTRHTSPHPWTQILKARAEYKQRINMREEPEEGGRGLASE